MAVAKQKRNLADEVAEGIREIMDIIDRALNPQKQRQRAPVPVPIPVRPQRRDPRYPTR